jgi:hypothetical protein
MRGGTRPDVTFRNGQVFLDQCTAASARTPESLRITVNHRSDRDIGRSATESRAR